jgi:hypothetical protein
VAAHPIGSTRFRFAVVAAVAVGCLLTACGGSSSSSPVGTYVRPHIPHGFTNRLTIQAGGTYDQAFTGVVGTPIRGRWSAHGGHLNFTETGGSGAKCIGQTGSYKWNLNGSQFTLTPVIDPCENRMTDFVAPFTKS